MREISFSLSPNEKVSSQKRRSRFQLSVRDEGLIVIATALVPTMVLGCGIGYIWWANGAASLMAPGTFPAPIAEFLSRASLYQYGLSLLAFIIFSITIAMLALELRIARPLHMLAAWLRIAQESEFTQVPVLPTVHRDEIGELTGLLSESIATFSQIKVQNVALMQEKSLFMTIAAHQLRTPLTGLLWSIDALLDPAITEDARKKILPDIDSLLKRMRLIVNHILASANVEGGKYGYVFEKTDMVPIITKLVDEFRPISESHGVLLKVEYAEGLFPVYADTERITLALFDLISNAIDYTPRGGSVTITVNPLGESLEIAVVDTGMGIAESEIPLLFSKFYRSERAKHVRPDGSGLGLFLVKDVIASHGSDVTVTSKEGSGSRFAFRLGTKKPQR